MLRRELLLAAMVTNQRLELPPTSLHLIPDTLAPLHPALDTHSAKVSLALSQQLP